ncbi:MAG: DegT/DnrJ/EryC1/StrS family aminotransferase [bacterium]|nr:DegT/DnrJ/EryC1/StrS family aminotransferase [bacterium]
MINISKPELGKEEEEAVVKVIRSGNLVQGEQVKAFEEEFAGYSGTKYAVAVENGTSALIVALAAAGIKRGDQVITTPFTFIATANAISFLGAEPVFVDIDEKTFNLDPSKIESAITKKTRAIMPVHIYGLMADMERIGALAKKHGLLVIEDAAQAHGASIKNKKAGSWGLAGTFSFYPSKNMTTGEGGMITTSDKALMEKAKIFRHQGMSAQYQHDSLGFNFRMTEIEAAIGRQQLKKLEGFTKKRIENAAYFDKQFSKISGLTTPFVPQASRHVYHQYTIKIEKPYPLERDQLLKKLLAEEIGARIYYPKLLSQEKIYSGAKHRDLAKAEKLHQTILSLPVHPGLTKNDLDKIVGVIKNV